jgi:hypothetical protein
METSSGYPSLDSSCLRSVERIETFGHLPLGYDKMTVLHHCTYSGPPTAMEGGSGAVEGAQQQSTKSTAVTN